MTASRRAWTLAGLLWTVGAWAQPVPHLGYLYPAGGQIGSSFRVTVGGQFLRGVNTVNVSGTGVKMNVVQWGDGMSRREIQWVNQWIGELNRRKREKKPMPGETGTPETPVVPTEVEKPITSYIYAVNGTTVKRTIVTVTLSYVIDKVTGKPVEPRKIHEERRVENVPSHPWFNDLEKRTIEQREELTTLLNDPKKQLNPQISENVILDVSIDANAPLGDREVRLGTPAGYTNPMVFQVGRLVEVREKELFGPELGTLQPPFMLNGQVMPGQVDQFKIRGRAGQLLVINCQARSLIPYLADAVPGWFQASLKLLDPRGREVGFADHYSFQPDPDVVCRLPENGLYTLYVRDSIFRGREDFIYRVAIGEFPFAASIFPLGARAGTKTIAAVRGWNLPFASVELNTAAGPDTLRQAVFGAEQLPPEALPYVVDTLPEMLETEPNNAAKQAEAVTLPVIINGTIGRSNDVDQFTFTGKAGEVVVAEVTARRLYSPLDSLLRIYDANGKVLATNDDRPDAELGLETHHADSYIRLKLPAAGTYRVELSDTQRRGGDDYAYRLRLSAPRPDFALRLTPSSINLPAGRTMPVLVTAVRKDGFDGEIELGFKVGTDGFTLSGNRIPRGQSKVRFTLTAPAQPRDEPFDMKLEGKAVINGATVTRRVVPAEDQMQAFLYRHLVPQEQLLVAVPKQNRGSTVVQPATSAPVQIPLGGTAEVPYKMPAWFKIAGIDFELDEAPKGLVLEGVKPLPGGFALVVGCDDGALPVGYADNLIVNVGVAGGLAPTATPGKRAGLKKLVNRTAVLPAVGFEIVAK